MQNTYPAEEPNTEPYFSQGRLYTPPDAGQNSDERSLLSRYDTEKSASSGRTSTPWFSSTTSLKPKITSDSDVPVAPWGIYWYTPASIVLLLFIGLGSAIGHHIFYNSLDGKPADSELGQEWVTRTGTALAFLCKASFAAVVGISRKQWVWRTLRNRSVSLGGIDAMFGVTSDPFLFFQPEILRRAKFSTVMALIMWMLPLSAVFTPGTISVYGEAPPPITCTVPSLKFEYGKEASNLTSDKIKTTLDRSNSDGYSRPSALAEYIVGVSMFSGRALSAISWPPNVTTLDEACGASKCTYEIQFEGPALGCEEKIPWDSPGAPWENETPSKELSYYSYRAGRSLSSRNSFWIQQLFEGKNHTYVCKSSVAKYSVELTVSNKTFLEPIIKTADIVYTLPDSLESNMANMTANYALFDALVNILSGSIRAGQVCIPAGMDTDTSGAITRTVGVGDDLDVAIYTISKDTDMDTAMANPKTITKTETMGSDLDVTSVFYETEYLADTQTIDPGLDVSTVFYTSATDTPTDKPTPTDTDTQAIDPGLDVSTVFYSTPTDEYTPTDADTITPTITATPTASMANVATQSGGANISKRSSGEDGGIICGEGKSVKNSVVTNGTQIYLTSLSGTTTRGEEGAHVPFLGQAIEDLFQKSTISLLSANSLRYAANTTTTCNHLEKALKYRYDFRKLVLIYTIAAAIVLIAAAVGFFALVKNGVASDANFSTILLTTRNPALDALTVGSCLGGNPLTKDIANLRLRFGETIGKTDVNGVPYRHAAIGLEGEVTQIRTDRNYS